MEAKFCKVHPDRPVKARGLCQSCYRAAVHAEKVASGAIKIDEDSGVNSKTGAPVEKDLSSDPTAVAEFFQILWGWLREAGKPIEPILTVGDNGKPFRNFSLEARKRESVDQKAMKAATVLGKAYIVERHIEDKPSDLPVEGMKEMVGGWMSIANMGKGKPDA